MKPSWLSINANTGLISGTPAESDAGDTTVTVQVSDGNGGVDTQTYPLHVKQVTAIGDPLENNIPTEFSLSQNYPNPFNPVTNIKFGMPKAGHVKIVIYNVLGQKVATLVDGFKPAGFHIIKFNASRLASGIYLYRIQTEGFSKVKRMILIK